MSYPPLGHGTSLADPALPDRAPPGPSPTGPAPQPHPGHHHPGHHQPGHHLHGHHPHSYLHLAGYLHRGHHRDTRHHLGPGPVIAIIVGMVVVLSFFGYLAGSMIASRDIAPDALDVTRTLTGPGPDGDTPAASPDAERAALKASMQVFVDALNSGDVQRIRASICSEVRPGVTKAPEADGVVILEQLDDTTVVGDTASSTVVTHLELHDAAGRTNSRRNPEQFVRENGTWLVCPGTETSFT